MDDVRFTELMTALWGGGSPAEDLWEIAMSDDDPEPAEVDPRMEALCERSIAEAGGDLLAPPVFDGMVGIFGATAEIEAGRDTHEDWDEWLEDWHGPSSKLPDRDDIRDQHPFPIDPDEEVQW